MDQVPVLNWLPEKYRGAALFILGVSPYVSRAVQALRNGGGVKGALAGIWLGTNTPKPQPEQKPQPSNPT